MLTHWYANRRWWTRTAQANTAKWTRKRMVSPEIGNSHRNISLFLPFIFWRKVLTETQEQLSYSWVVGDFRWHLKEPQKKVAPNSQDVVMRFECVCTFNLGTLETVLKLTVSCYTVSKAQSRMAQTQQINAANLIINMRNLFERSLPGRSHTHARTEKCANGTRIAISKEICRNAHINRRDMQIASYMLIKFM